MAARRACILGGCLVYRRLRHQATYRPKMGSKSAHKPPRRKLPLQYIIVTIGRSNAMVIKAPKYSLHGIIPMPPFTPQVGLLYSRKGQKPEVNSLIR